MGRIGREEFLSSHKLPLTVVLDNIRSLHNVGSVFRTSDAFRVERILLCGITATPPARDIHKTALGAEMTVRWEYAEKTTEAVMRLKEAGYRVLAVEQVEGAVMLNDFRTDEGAKYALVFGNEVAGVEQQVVDLADGAIEIPQVGTKHSLNVSVSGGVVLWNFFCQIGSK